MRVSRPTDSNRPSSAARIDASSSTTCTTALSFVGNGIAVALAWPTARLLSMREAPKPRHPVILLGLLQPRRLRDRSHFEEAAITKAIPGIDGRRPFSTIAPRARALPFFAYTLV